MNEEEHYLASNENNDTQRPSTAAKIRPLEDFQYVVQAVLKIYRFNKPTGYETD